MNNALKFLLAAVGLIVTVTLCYYGISMLGRGKDMADIVSEAQDNSLKTSKEYGLLKYDGYTINGSTAINYIKTAVTDYEVVAYIKKGTGSSATTGIIQYVSDFTFMRDVTSPTTYVNPLKEYKCTVYSDANGVFTHIDIVEQ